MLLVEEAVSGTIVIPVEGILTAFIVVLHLSTDLFENVSGISEDQDTVCKLGFSLGIKVLDREVCRTDSFTIDKDVLVDTSDGNEVLNDVL